MSGGRHKESGDDISVSNSPDRKFIYKFPLLRNLLLVSLLLTRNIVSLKPSFTIFAAVIFVLISKFPLKFVTFKSLIENRG